MAGGEALDEVDWRPSILDALPYVVIVIDEMARVIFAGGALKRLLGLSPTDWVGRSALDAVHPDDLVAVTDVLELIRTEPNVARPPVRFRVLTSIGGWMPVEASGWVIIDTSHGNGLVLSLRDVTGRVTIEMARSLDARVATNALHEPENALQRRSWVIDNVLKTMALREDAAGQVLIIVIGFAADDVERAHLSSTDVQQLMHGLEGIVLARIRTDDVALMVSANQLMIACAGVSNPSTGFEIASRFHAACSAQLDPSLPQGVVLQTGLALTSQGDKLDEALDFAMHEATIVGPPVVVPSRRGDDAGRQ